MKTNTTSFIMGSLRYYSPGSLCRLKLRFHFCADIPKNGCSPRRRGIRGIEIYSGEDSSFDSPVRSFDSSEVPKLLPDRECKSKTRSRSGNRCGLHFGPSSIRYGCSSNCVRGEREGPRPFCLNKGDAGPSKSMRDDPGPSQLGHHQLHSNRDRETSPWISYHHMERERDLLRETLTCLKKGSGRCELCYGSCSL
ncbi:unnamed protein product [Prunus armeniaca]|uniref:Uncharacterized protein n=1 Tax=Prunus armeniaca TaxID=36596 RepID=A0A6J5W5Y4_PRUAR|nr:unnamed protein product [Prunus armeniaca]CAB4295044.1 unnamed protein product [Prunus armeniaca]